jgi:2-polyprenyl-3-methyl-5-hydroxy-6-metoxy-1,4-benzoquinol methylase
MAEPVPQLDDDALALFARKGLEAGPGAPQVGESNAVKVRRVMQLTTDLGSRPFDQLRILDLGCGEGVYAIEAALRGAQVLALDARRERMAEGAAVAARHGLDNVEFRLEDARSVSPATHGEFEVIYLLGLLYHLDAPEALALLQSVHELCAGLLVIDTLVSLAPDTEVEHSGVSYEGERRREHADEDPPETRRARLLRSIDSTFAFLFTRESLVRALRGTGFSSVFECHVPAEPGKARDRITLAARKGAPVEISAYPWINQMSEEEIARRLERIE